MNDFLCTESVLQSGLEPASLIIIRHVLEHIDDFRGFFDGIDRLATPDATLLIEVPDLSSTIAKSIYSNIYHIHPCYFDVRTITALLNRNGWETKGSISVNTFGGSLLVWARRKGRNPGLHDGPAFSFDEIACAASCCATRAELDGFVSGWKAALRATRDFFDQLRERGARVAGYGAAERTTALMGMAGLDGSHISLLFDRNHNLAGKLLPGSRVPIQPADEIKEHRFEFLAIFAQSFEDEIVEEQRAFREAGGKFISLRSGRPEVLK